MKGTDNVLWMKRMSYNGLRKRSERWNREIEGAFTAKIRIQPLRLQNEHGHTFERCRCARTEALMLVRVAKRADDDRREACVKI